MGCISSGYKRHNLYLKKMSHFMITVSFLLGEAINDIVSYIRY